MTIRKFKSCSDNSTRRTHTIKISSCILVPHDIQYMKVRTYRIAWMHKAANVIHGNDLPLTSSISFYLGCLPLFCIWRFIGMNVTDKSSSLLLKLLILIFVNLECLQGKKHIRKSYPDIEIRR